MAPVTRVLQRTSGAVPVCEIADDFMEPNQRRPYSKYQNNTPQSRYRAQGRTAAARVFTTAAREASSPNPIRSPSPIALQEQQGPRHITTIPPSDRPPQHKNGHPIPLGLRQRQPQRPSQRRRRRPRAAGAALLPPPLRVPVPGRLGPLHLDHAAPPDRDHHPQEWWDRAAAAATTTGGGRAGVCVWVDMRWYEGSLIDDHCRIDPPTPPHPSVQSVQSPPTPTSIARGRLVIRPRNAAATREGGEGRGGGAASGPSD